MNAAGAPRTRTPLLHVDMDAFYASVMTRDRPELQQVPVIVGGGHRGVVLAANYPAREFGVRSAMTGAQAQRLCPQAVRLTPDYALFATVSDSVREIFHRVTPLVEPVSSDEAFLDVSGAVRLLGAPEAIAEWVRARVFDEQAITCSVGVAASISVAKLASRRAKPDGVLVIEPDRVAEVVHPLDVGELYGVGVSTRERLHRLGLITVGDVARTPVADLQARLGRHLGEHLHRLAWGTDRASLDPGAAGVFGSAVRSGESRPDHSMGAQRTFGADTADREVIARHLLSLAGGVCARLRSAELVGRTVALTVRFADFRTISRSRTLPEATDVTREVHRVAVALFDAQRTGRAPIRLVGVRVEGLRTRHGAHRQGVLGEPEHGWRDAERAVDGAVARFGRDAVRPASLLR